MTWDDACEKTIEDYQRLDSILSGEISCEKVRDNGALFIEYKDLSEDIRKKVENHYKRCDDCLDDIANAFPMANYVKDRMIYIQNILEKLYDLDKS